jgi:site-specific recombinase XerD
MAKAPVVEDKDLRHMLKVAAVSGEFPVRDVALLYLIYGTGAMLTEVASLLTGDYRVEGANARAARRTFGVRLYRKGYDLRHIAELLGLSTVSAVKRLVDEDPIKLGDIVASVI